MGNFILVLSLKLNGGEIAVSEFVFNNYIDFGIFLKVNSEEMLKSSDVNIHDGIKVFLALYENSKGGCGCNIKKRQQIAIDGYIKSVPIIFNDPAAVAFIKQVLGSDKITFNQSPDNMGFLII